MKIELIEMRNVFGRKIPTNSIENNCEWMI